jgi:hypothetical protein
MARSLRWPFEIVDPSKSLKGKVMSSISTNRSLARFAFIVAVAAALLTASNAIPAHAALSPELTCAFAKQRAALREVNALLSCDRKALATQTAVDPKCTDAAVAGLQQAFQIIEAKGGCVPSGDVDLVGRNADRCAQDIDQQLGGTCQASGATCGGSNPPCCTGLVCIGVGGDTPTCGLP